MADDVEAPAPSAGAEGQPSVSAPTPSAPEAAEPVQTDDEIWDSHAEETAAEPAAAPTTDDGEEPPAPEKAEEEEPEPEEETAAKADEEPEKEEAKGKEDEKPVIEPLLPAELRTVMETLKDHPKLKAAVRNTYYSLAAFREVYETPGEARAIKELIPTVEDAKQLSEKAEAKDGVDWAFENDPIGLAQGLAREQPAQFQSLIGNLPEALATYRNPETGEPDDRYYRMASAAFFSNSMRRLAAKYADDETMTEAIALINQAAGLKTGGEATRPANDPETIRLRQENERFKAERSEAVEADYNRFDAQLLTSFQGSVSKEINGYLAGVFAKGGFTKGAQEAIVKEIFDHAFNSVSPWIHDNLPTIIRRGSRDSAQRDQIVKGLLARVRPFIRSQKTGEIVSRWTKDILGTNRKEISKRDEVAARRDAGSGGHSGSGPRRVTAEKDVSEMTPKEKAAFYADRPDDQDVWAKHGL